MILLLIVDFIFDYFFQQTHFFEKKKACIFTSNSYITFIFIFQIHREFKVLPLKVFESAGKYPPAVSIDLVLLGGRDFPTDASNNITQLE